MLGRGFVAAAVAAMLVWPCVAGAQEPNQVTGLTATQEYGFTTLKWNPVAGATDYQIERTPVDANDAPTAAGDDRRRLAVAAHDHAGLADVRGVGLPARRALHLARAGAPGHRQPAAVLGCR